MSGETVKIKPASGQSLALLFNELIANAERHGALTSESGELHIEWKETDDGMICIHWSEQGLQGVLLPETRGFGFSVLQRIIKQQLGAHRRSEEHTSELQSLMRNSYAVFCLKKKTKTTTET